MGQGSSTASHGFHVVKVKPGSPGNIAGLVPYFDYLVSVNDAPLNVNNSLFVKTLQENVDSPVKVGVFNSKTQKTRDVTIVPSTSWDENGKELLGVSIRFCNIKESCEYVWHILEVFPDSPATEAGLQPFDDYIVGSANMIFQSSEDFFNLVAANMGRPLEFFVYNCRTDNIRSVTLTPNKKWGGEGSLGCHVAYGLLHKIPVRDALENTNNSDEPNQTLPTTPIPQIETIQQSPTKVPSPIVDRIPKEPETDNLPVPEELPVEITKSPITNPSPVIPQNPIKSNNTKLPTTINASVPTVHLPKPNLPVPSISQGSLVQPQENDLESLQKKQEALQKRLAELRSQMTPK